MNGISVSIVNIVSIATGIGVTGFTVIYTLAVSHSLNESHISYTKLSTPTKQSSGVYVKLQPVIVTVPLTVGVINTGSVIISPGLGSESLSVKHPVVKGVPSSVIYSS